MIDAMKQALEALSFFGNNVSNPAEEFITSKAIVALRQAIVEAERESTLQEITDIGQEAHTDHPMRHWDRTCPACVAEANKQEPVTWAETNDMVCALLRQAHDVLACASSPPPKREIDMSTKPQNVYTSKERVQETDKSIHEDDDIQEYKKPWVGLTDEEMSDTYNQHYNTYVSNDIGIVDVIVIARAIEAKLKEKNNG
jgi:hypothetical protein